MICRKCKRQKYLCEICKKMSTSDFVLDYTPVCPRGYLDCMSDPGYMKHNRPELYKEIYGDLSPEDAIKVSNGCLERVKVDPDEANWCYIEEVTEEE